MTQSDPIREFAIDVVRRLKAAGFVALWAGGCVRDIMLGRMPKDYDVATDARPEQVRTLFGHHRTLPVGESFGVIIVLGPRKESGQIEVATFRTEGAYADGRRPDSVAFSTPEEDAKRRDFTINGMFFDPLQERIHDYVGGERDLGQGIIRAIGSPRDRMTEDKLRMLRAIRFTATLDFQIDAQTATAVRDMAPQILVVSWERIAQELRRMLVDAHRERAMRLCHELGLLQRILPELEDILTPDATRSPSAAHRNWWSTLHILGNLKSPSFPLAMAALLHTVPAVIEQLRRPPIPGSVRAACRRLKLSNEETERISWLVAQQHALDAAESLELAALKRLLVHPGAEDLLTLARQAALAEHRDTAGLDFAIGYRSRTPATVLAPADLVSGADLKALGLMPGPRFKEVLEQVRVAQLNEVLATRAEALTMVQQLANAAEET